MFVCVLGRERGLLVYTTFPPTFLFCCLFEKKE